MYKCPSCHAPSIRFIRKWLSYPAIPAFCGECQRYSHAHRTSGGLGLVVAAFGITVAGIVASALQAIWPLLLGIGSALAFYVRHIHRIPLELLTPEQVSEARNREGVGVIGTLLLYLWNWH